VHCGIDPVVRYGSRFGEHDRFSWIKVLEGEIAPAGAASVTSP
jgi:hypothetical protein